MTAVTVLDYGIGNLLNVVRALEHCGATVTVQERAGRRLDGHVVLPGVGAFPDAIAEIRARGFDSDIRDHVLAERPFLGICVGMQVMFDAGEEFGITEGLGLIAGSVVPIPEHGTDGRRHRIPLVGWRPLQPCEGGVPWSRSVLRDIPPGTHAYFVHSFNGRPARGEDVLAQASYDGIAICAAVQRGSAIGCQFHPEKSAEAGLRLLRTFLEF
jgi:glutamine amidotransferase